MAEVEGTRTFQATAAAYDSFMGRYSRALAVPFADFCGWEPGMRVVDVGCGPGALTAVAIDRLGSGQVVAVDPTPGFVAACRERFPGVDVRQGAAENLPLVTGSFNSAVAQLVFHFVSDPKRAAVEMIRVVHPGGRVAVNVWDFEAGMQMLRAFWDAALALNSAAPDELRTMRFGRAGELVELFEGAGLADVEEAVLSVESEYTGFDELWATFLSGIGPAGAYTVRLPAAEQAGLRDALFDRLGRPGGPFTLRATARAVRGTRVG